MANSQNKDIYIRNLEDVKTIIKHAKLDEKNLTPITQAVYYPDESIIFDNLKILEVDQHILEEIQEGQKLHFKGGLNEKAVLCTTSKTYEIKEAEISNSLLLVPDLKFGQATSTSPLKSPKNANSSYEEKNLNDSNEDDDIPYARTLERKNVLKIFHDYYECREIQPQYRKLIDLLQLTRYSGAENEHNIDRKLKFTYQQLLNTIQCSESEFNNGLKKYHAFEIDGFIRCLEIDYEYRIISLMVGLISENSWNLNEIDKSETITLLQGLAPEIIVKNLFDFYTQTSNIEGKYKYHEEMIARIIAQNILQPGLKFELDEFICSWQEALPEGMVAQESYLQGLGVIDKDSPIPCVRSLCEDNLPTNLHERLKMLFKTKTRWTLNEIKPYVEYFETPACLVTSLLAKQTRSITLNGIRFYVSKH